jgi:uncharacterized protein DUF1214
MLQTDQQFLSVGSEKGAVVNSDTSVDVYFGPKAPPGHESNWVQTWPGKGWLVILRLFGPEQAFFDKGWSRARSRRCAEKPPGECPLTCYMCCLAAEPIRQNDPQTEHG